MKKILLSIFGLVLALSVGAQTNLITNPGFETGDDTGWAGYNRSVIAAADAFEGDYVGAINDDAAGSFLYPSIIVKPGSTYRFALAAKWPNGCSVAGVAMVVKTVTDGVTYPNNQSIGQTPNINTTDWKVDSMELIVPEGVTEVKLVHWKGKSEICYIDSLVFYEVLNPNPIPDIILSDDDEILEAAEDGEVITVNMTNDVFANPLVPENWTVSNLPAGVTVGAVSRVSDTEATITLSGNATLDYDVDITDFTVVIAGAEFSNYEWPVTVNTGVTFIATVEVVTEEVIWEEDFSTWTPDIELDSAYLASMDFRTQGAPDSIKVIDGVGHMYSSDANSKNNWMFRTIELIPGASYIFSMDLKTPAGKTRPIIWGAQDDQIQGELLEASTEFTTVTVPFTVGTDKDTVELGVYKWGGTGTESNFDNWKLSIIMEPLIQASNDGEILEGSEEGEKITVSAMYDTFVASPNIANWSATGLPTGVTLGSLNRVSDTSVEITLAGNATIDYDMDSLVVITATQDEFVTSEKQLTAYAPVVFTATVEPPPALTLSDDGEILEGAEDTEVLTLTIADDTFVASLTAGNWTVSNLPTGVTAAVARVSDTEVSITLSGNATEDYDMDITDVTVTIAAAEITTYAEDLMVSTGVTLTATVEPAVITISDDGDITEGAEDGEVITVTLSEDTFVASLTVGNWTVTNLPAGVTAGSVSRTGDTSAEITLSGNTTDDYDTDITDVSVTVAAAELTLSATDVTASGVTFTAVIESAIKSDMIEGLQLYPNPVINRLNISAESTIESIRVYDLLGSKIFEKDQINSSYFELVTDSWNSGIYIVNIEDSKDRKSVYKVVK